MSEGRFKILSLRLIADAVSRSDVAAARDALTSTIGAVLVVSGKVRKVVKRDEQCKLVIEPGEVPGFVVFADCRTDAEMIKKAKIRKGSSVFVRGRLLSFGESAVCLSDCRLLGKNKEKQRKNCERTAKSYSNLQYKKRERNLKKPEIYA